MDKRYLEGNVTGIKAYVDGYIVLRGSIVYMSSFGGAEAVKGFQAGFLSNMDVNLDVCLRYSRSYHNYKMWTQKLTQAVTHGLVFAEELFDLSKAKKEAIIIGETKRELLDKTFALLQSKTTVPMLDSWKQPIVIDTVERTQLEDSFGMGLAYHVVLPNDDVLEAYVKSNLESLRKRIN